jgi:hypothetical protein
MKFILINVFVLFNFIINIIFILLITGTITRVIVFILRIR